MEPPADPRVSRAGVVLTAGVAVGVVVLHLVGVFLLDRRLELVLADQERNLITWLSSSAAVAVAVGALVALVLRASHRPALAVVAAGSAFLSFDEAIELHERLGPELAELLGASEATGDRLQLVTIAPVLGAVFLGAGLLALRAPPDVRRLLVAGLVALVGAVAIEQVLGGLTNALEASGPDWPDVLRVALEEAAEVTGWLLLATGILALTTGGAPRPAPGRGETPAA